MLRLPFRFLSARPWPLGLVSRLGDWHRGGFRRSGEQREKFALAVYTGEPHEDVIPFALMAKTQRHAPALGKNPQNVLESIRGVDGTPAKTDDFVPIPQPPAVGIAGLDDVVHGHPAILIHRDLGDERGVVHDPPALQAAEEVLDLVDGDGVTHADRDPTSLIEGGSAVDADDAGLHSRTTVRRNCRG